MHAIGRYAPAMALVGLLVAALLRPRAAAGPVLRVEAVGPGPTTLVLDTATHRIFAGTIWRGAAIAVLDSRSGALIRMVALPAGVGPPASLLVDARAGRVSSEAQDGSRAAFDAASGAILTIAPALDIPRVVPLGGTPFQG